MKGDLIRDDGALYEVIWDGEHRGANADLFARLDEPVVVAEKPRRISRQAACETLAECFEQGSLWQTARLREVSGLTEAEFEVALNRLRRNGVVISVSRGVVRLVKSEREAA